MGGQSLATLQGISRKNHQVKVDFASDNEMESPMLPIVGAMS